LDVVVIEEEKSMNFSRAVVLFMALSGCLRDPPRASARESVSVVSPSVVQPSVIPTTPMQPGPAQELAPLRQPVRWVVRTTGATDENERLPLIVAIHGLGDTPEAFVGLITEMQLRVRIAAPAGLESYGEGYAWFPSRLGGPRAQWVAGIRHAADVMVPAMQRLMQEHPTCGLPIVTGFSQGGMLSFALAARANAGVFAALPIAGVLPRELWPATRPPGGLAVQVWAFHGSADERVPFDLGRETVGAFQAAGYATHLGVYPAVNHQVTREITEDLRRKILELLQGQGC
jgi:phospholipase/carboxylesterase